MHTVKRIPRQDFPNLTRNWWWLLSYRGAEQRDKAFHHLSLLVILLPLTWSPELAKANYLGQTVSISKHSQQIAFHYWHARQARKLSSTHRDRQSPNGQILIPTRPDATIAALNERHRACDLFCTTGAKSDKVISNGISLFAHSSAISKILQCKIYLATETTTEAASEIIQEILAPAPKQPLDIARILGVNQNQSGSDSTRWNIN